jgi:NhaA family Na+:H+ antiporter
MTYIWVMLKRFSNPLHAIIHDSRSLGIILSLCTIVSLVWANSAMSGAYTGFWLKEFHLPEAIHLPHSLLHWINDFLMAIFFFLVGMEIKRELLEGELREIKRALLPIFGAIGGMVVPAFMYNLFNKGTAYAPGWGIPMATDIAFSLGIASLLGKRVPVSLKIFLTALAIIDDLGAIAMIAVFYGGKIQWLYMGLAALCSILLYVLGKRKATLGLRVPLALALWYFVFNSGVHATVAGVVFAFTIPMSELRELEHRLHTPVNFLILPIFALANTAIVLPAELGDTLNSTLNHGILAGLVIGKPLGILLFCYLLVRLNWGKLPTNVNWMEMAGVGMLAGIGFTMSIFISMLAFSDSSIQDSAKIGVLLASLLSVVLGAVTLRIFGDNSR